MQLSTGKLTIRYSLLLSLIAAIVLIEGNYWSLLSIFIGSALMRYLVWGVVLLTSVFCLRTIRLPRQMLYTIVPWLAYLFLIIFRNQELSNGEYINTLRLILCVSSMLILTSSADWVLSLPKILVIVGAPNIIATLIFFLNNNLYELFIRASYGSYQSGTANGQYGYRAGIADHYSQNATYICIVLIVLFAVLFCGGGEKKIKGKKKRSKILLVCFALTLISLLLTEKRAHLLFGGAVLILVYVISNQKNFSKRLLKVFVILALALGFCGFFIENIPILQDILSRFSHISSDDNILIRFGMWRLALERFFDHPILGIGWFGYMWDSSITAVYSEASTGCHNVYIQMLCEIGIIGILIFMVCVISSLVSTYKMMRVASNTPALSKYNSVLCASFAIQAFILLYCLTGNCMYDRTFNFYIIAVAVNLALRRSGLVEQSLSTKKGIG